MANPSLTVVPTSLERTPSNVSEGSERHPPIVVKRKKNAQAQAEFRARRAGYIKALEETIEKLEIVLINHQDSWRKSQAEVFELQQENERLRQDQKGCSPSEVYWAQNIAHASQSHGNFGPFSPPHALSSSYPLLSSVPTCTDSMLWAESAALVAMQDSRYGGTSTGTTHLPTEKSAVCTAFGDDQWAMPGRLEPHFSLVHDSGGAWLSPLPCKEALQGVTALHYLPKSNAGPADTEISSVPESVVEMAMISRGTNPQDKMDVGPQAPCLSDNRLSRPPVPLSTVEVIRTHFLGRTRKRKLKLELKENTVCDGPVFA
ncbi:hypothetical protein CVT26_006967 [Gymnopilus dilepis]|uniref:BZIP domain-containing protein n=1 Tax=Gymnopilus dilepis TaxID=231916 RepID=A0A409WQI7_9AGAR|nr:hypothetical protein CVT26_006967 [Gymnopilus dilepis]